MAGKVEGWWATSDVAAWCGVAPSTIRAYAVRGQMPKPRYIGKTMVWRPATIRRWRPNGPGKPLKAPGKPDQLEGGQVDGPAD